MSKIITVFQQEYKAIMKHKMVLILFIAPLLYPLLYGTVYFNEVVRDIPVTVVDLSESARSRAYIRSLDATPELRIYSHCTSLEEARELFYKREVQGIILIPSGFSDTRQQAKIPVYFDMGSFFYYKGMMTAVAMVSKAFGTEQLQQPLNYQGIALFNTGSGFASFLLPAVLSRILFQTLLLGIAVLTGAGNESGELVASLCRYGIGPSLSGKILCYLSLYIVWTAYALCFIPALFNLPHLGNLGLLLLLFLPFLLSAICFALTLASLMRTAERAFLYLLFLSLPLLFLSGVSWPMSNMPAFWKAVGAMLPTTHAIQAFVRINTMQAGLGEVVYELSALWGLTALYAMTAYGCYARKRRKTTVR